MFLIFFAKIHPFSETSKISADFLFAIARNVGRTKKIPQGVGLAGRENVYCEGHRYIGSLFRVDEPVPMIQQRIFFLGGRERKTIKTLRFPIFFPIFAHTK